MVVTLEQVITVLSPEEPNYGSAARLGSEALPHLDALIKSEDLSLAVKATSLASYIQDNRSVEILMNAAKSKHDVVRLAAAVGSPNLKVKGVNLVLNLLSNDKDPSIRKFAITSMESIGTEH